MTKKFALLPFVNQLVACEPRAGRHLVKAKRLILQVLKSHGLKYKLQSLPQVLANNVLVGDLSRPRTILFTHFDAIGPGALDNASGVAVCLKVLIEQPDFLKDNLVVFSGNEEMSPEKPIYWGYGYRQFEKKYRRLLKTCRAIYVVDCVGNGRLHFFQGDYYFHEAVPLKNLAAVKDKLFVLTGKVKHLLAVCHTEKDTVAGLSEKYLEASYKELVQACYRI